MFLKHLKNLIIELASLLNANYVQLLLLLKSRICNYTYLIIKKGLYKLKIKFSFMYCSPKFNQA